MVQQLTAWISLSVCTICVPQKMPKQEYQQFHKSYPVLLRYQIHITKLLFIIIDELLPFCQHADG